MIVTFIVKIDSDDTDLDGLSLEIKDFLEEYFEVIEVTPRPTLLQPNTILPNNGQPNLTP